MNSNDQLREVVRKIREAPNLEAAEAYIDELLEAIFGPQQKAMDELKV